MNHPYLIGKSKRSKDLLANKRTDEVLDRHIRFCDLHTNDELDYERCYVRELNRTKLFLGKELDLRSTNA